MIEPRSYKQLFLDDGAIETKYGLRRTLNKPDRVGPVMRPDRSRGQVTLQSSSTPQWNSEKKLWEWWYRSGYSDPPSDAVYSKSDLIHGLRIYHYATSTDGLHWERPNLGLYEWFGSQDNNIAVDPHGMHAGSVDTMYNVVRDEDEQYPDRRYKALFATGGNDRYPYVSPDGFKWERVDVPPIPSGDTSHLTYDEITEQFIATVKIRTRWGRSIWLSTSYDFIDWTEPVLIFHTDEIDTNNRRRRIRHVVEDPAYLTPHSVDKENYYAEVYKMSIMPYEGLYIGLPVLFNPSGPWGKGHTGINQAELAVSRDLYNWNRVAGRDVFLGVLPWDGETYDTAQVIPCGRPIVREDLGEIWIYYDSCRFRSRKEDVDETHRKYFDEDLNAVCLAKLRMDGFVSLDALKKGTMLTRPFVLDRGDVYVNVESQDGELLAEVVDADTMESLPGMSVSDCDKVKADVLRGRLTWNGKGAFACERPVRLRFELDQAKLYAFWID